MSTAKRVVAKYQQAVNAGVPLEVPTGSSLLIKAVNAAPMRSSFKELWSTGGRLKVVRGGDVGDIITVDPQWDNALSELGHTKFRLKKLHGQDLILVDEDDSRSTLLVSKVK